MIGVTYYPNRPEEKKYQAESDSHPFLVGLGTTAKEAREGLVILIKEKVAKIKLNK